MSEIIIFAQAADSNDTPLETIIQLIWNPNVAKNRNFSQSFNRNVVSLSKKPIFCLSKIEILLKNQIVCQQ